jgi:hypothetical protein
MSAPLPRLTAQRREWLTEASTARYEDLQILLASYDAVPGLVERVERLETALRYLAADVRGALGIGRHGIIAAVGATNVACIERRLEEASALASVAEQPQPAKASTEGGK